jgi:hypothetical protein
MSVEVCRRSGCHRRIFLAQHRRVAQLGAICWLLSIEDAGKAQQCCGCAGWALCGAVADTMAILAEIGTGQRHMLHREESHVGTPIISIANMSVHGFTALEEVPLV